MQTAQTQLSAFLVAAGNAVQYVRQDEAVQLSTTVRLCMGLGLGVQALGLGGLSRHAMQLCGAMSQDLRLLALHFCTAPECHWVRSVPL